MQVWRRDADHAEVKGRVNPRNKLGLPGCFVATLIGSEMKKTVVARTNAIQKATDLKCVEMPLTPAVSNLVDLLVEMASRRAKAVEQPSTTMGTQKQ